MAKQRRIIRTTRPTRLQRLDDQLWPLVAGLVVLGGFVGGTILAYLRLDDPRWYANAWTWLIVTALAIGAGAGALAWTGHRLMRRTMQLAMVICAIIHLVLFIVAVETNVFHRVWVEVLAVTEQTAPRRAVTVPDYASWQHDARRRVQSDLHQRVITELPDPEVQPVQEATQERPRVEQRQPHPVPEPEETRRPNVVPRPQQSDSLPRQRDEMSRLSRKEAPDIPQPTPAAHVPSLPRLERPAHDRSERAESSEPAPSALEKAQPERIASRESAAAPAREIVVRPAPSPSPTRQPSPPSDAMAQTPRTVPNRQPRVTTRPDLASPVETPATASADVAVAAPRIEPGEPRPAERTAAPQLARVDPAAASTPTPSVPSPTPAERGRREVSAPRERDDSPVTLPSSDRRPADAVPWGAVAQRVSPVAPDATATEPSQAAAASLAAARTDIAPSAAGNRAAERTRPSHETVGSADLQQTAPRQWRRTEPDSLPAIRGQASTALPRERSPREAPSATTPLQAESPTLAAASSHLDAVQPTPAPLALSQSQVGIAPRGSSPNLGQDAPAPDSPAVTASGSVERARASQAMPEGPALSPQTAALVRAARADQLRPSTMLEATPAQAATRAGGPDPAELQASASAALTSAASNSTRDTVTGAKGAAEVDMGPTIVVGESGAGRAAGGGSAVLSGGAEAPLAPRRPIGQIVPPSLLADTLGPSSSAPAADGGGEPSAVDVAVEPNALVRAQPAPPDLQLGGPDAVPGGAESAPSAAVAAGSRAALRDRLDGPAVPEGRDRVSRTVPTARRDRQLAAELGVADTDAGTAAARNDPDPPGRFAASSQLDASVEKQATSDRQILSAPGFIAAPESRTDPISSTVAAARRAEATEGMAGEPRAGGGTDSPARSGQGPVPALNVDVDLAGDWPHAATPEPRGEQTAQTRGESTGPSASDEPASVGDPRSLGADVSSMPALRVNSPAAPQTSRPVGPALPVNVDVPPGAGGLLSDLAADIGLPSRMASPTSSDVQWDTPRFARDRAGGQPDFSTVAVVPTESYRRRTQRADGDQAPADSVGPRTEEAIERGLVFLQRAQDPDGRWTLQRFTADDGPPQLASDTAATGLALLAFQGAGYNHLQHRYAAVVRRGMDFLVRSQQGDGCLVVPMDEKSNQVILMYSHSLAALALCEAYGMTQDDALREPAQKALDYIVQSQHPTRGGWRYSPRVSSDTSVTGWMMMALRSGELANLQVPADTYDKIRQWLDQAQASPTQPHLYRYNPFAPDTDEQRTGRRPSATMTSVGLLMRLYSGWRRDHPAMARGAQYLLKTPPAVGTSSNPQRDTYYWYYATQVMFHMGGEYWSAWNQRLHPLLLNSQVTDGPLAGSWDPNRPVPDRWAPFAGRIYVTTMNLLSLEVAYRHLPLYDDTAR